MPDVSNLTNIVPTCYLLADKKNSYHLPTVHNGRITLQKISDLYKGNSERHAVVEDPITTLILFILQT